MELSKPVQQKLEEKTGLELIWESRSLFSEILFCFRECHDVCVQSELFSDVTILAVDQCAVDFRQLSMDTVLIAKRVSNQWLDVAISFFENIDDAENPQEMLKLLGDQARELAQCFKLIAAWARDLGGRFHEAQDGTIKEAEEFKREFSAAVERAESVKKQAEENLDKAKKLHKEAQQSEDTWKTWKVALAWIPISFIVTVPGTAAAEKETAEASKLEAKASKKLRENEQELEKRMSQNEKAKFVAGKAAKLITVLGKLEETCEAISTFWIIEADKFDSQGAKMKTNQAVMIKGMKGKVCKDNITFWTETKDELDRYITAMSATNSYFNFARTANAKPSTYQSIKFANLDLKLHLPATVDVKAITD